VDPSSACLKLKLFPSKVNANVNCLENQYLLSVLINISFKNNYARYPNITLTVTSV